ncbi:LamG domain-containing protein [Bacteroidales bacterium OttesenSCG-928-L03]|nr:LamG domain-containing protein [Bacteroidales bacterium OttesenSCG-928-L03]
MKKKNYVSRLKDWSKYTLLLCALLISGNAFADLADGLIVHYTFDEDNGSTVNDQSGNSNNGELFGNASIRLENGKTGGALYLGTVSSPATDYLQVANGITTNLENFTVAAWINVDDIKDWQRIFDFGENQNNNMFLTVKGGNGIRFAIKEEVSKKEQQIQGTALTIGQWMHVLVTVDYSTSTGRLYIDGVLVGTNSSMTYKPQDMIGSTQNFIGKAQYPDPGYNGYIDDFRVYNRALGYDEVLALNGFTMEEIIAQEELLDALEKLNDPAIIESILDLNYSWGEIEYPYNLNLITSLPGFDNVVLSWSSSNPDVIAEDGTVANVSELTTLVLTVTLTHPDLPGKPLTKEFKASVIKEPLPAQIAVWNFENASYNSEDGKITLMSTSDDSSISYKGTFEGTAAKRVIGTGDNQFTVLATGDSDGYFDMGKEIGQTIYQMTNGFSMGGYFFVEEEAPTPTGAGNYFWCFSNSDKAATDKNGSIYGRPWNSIYNITTGRWDSGNRFSVEKANHFIDGTSPSETQLAYRGAWHHMFYAQTGSTGTVYIDGEAVATLNNITVMPSDLRIEGRKGTDFNFLGRSQYEDNGDSRFKNALFYDFRLYGYGMSSGDMIDLHITETLSNLNTAYAVNDGKEIPQDLLDAAETLEGNFDVSLYGKEIYESDVINLPNNVEGYSNITVQWSASNSNLMDKNGNFIHYFYDYDLPILTATLVDINTGVSVVKEFEISAVVKAGTSPVITESGKIIHFDFDGTTDKVNGISGELLNNATTRIIGKENTFNVLDLGESNGYFDMSTKTGEIIANLETNFTIASYFYIDTTYTELGSAGNFLWTFSNSTNSASEKNGYFMLSLGSQRAELTAETYNAGVTANLVLERNEDNAYIQASKGEWYFVAITGEEGLVEDERFLTYYMYRTDSISGELVSLENSMSVNKTLKENLLKTNAIGTVYNWIGRPNFSADKYLRKTLVHDFRIYNKGLTTADFEGEEFNDVKETLKLLNLALKENDQVALETISKDTPYRVYTDGKNIRIIGLQGDETIALFDITGRQYNINDVQQLVVDKSGIYILRINNYAIKVLVR